MAKTAVVELVNGNTYIYNGPNKTYRFDKDVPVAVEEEVAQYLEQQHYLRSFDGGAGKVAVQQFAVEYYDNEEEPAAIEAEYLAEQRAKEDAVRPEAIAETIKAVSSRARKNLPEVEDEPSVMLKKAVSNRAKRARMDVWKHDRACKGSTA